MFISELFLTFVVYSFLGYLCEVTYCSLGARKLVNRGFLYGPWLPIYGFGGIIVKLCLYPYREFPLFVFIIAIILTSALEYVTSYLMEKIFNMKLWDYTTYKCNINGRVCLQNSLMFGGLSLLLTYIIEPKVELFLDHFSGIFINVTALILFTLFVVDIIFSVITAVGFEKIIESIDELKEERIERITKNARYKSFVKRYPGLKIKGKELVLDRIKARVLKLQEKIEEVKEDIDEFKNDLKDTKQDLKDLKENVKQDYLEKTKDLRNDLKATKQDLIDLKNNYKQTNQNNVNNQDKNDK